MKTVCDHRAGIRLRLRWLPAITALTLLALPLSAQDRPAARADLVRQVLATPGDGDAWSALETEATAAADGPFVLREVRVRAEEGVLALELGGYGLPTLEQSMKAGRRTRVVVTLPGARSALPHGIQIPSAAGFDGIRVRHAPFGVEVEATLPEGMAAVIEETADGVEIRSLRRIATVVSSPPRSAAGDRLSVLIAVGRTWVASLRAGRPLALFPAAGMAALLLVCGAFLLVRRRPAGRSWQTAADAQRLAERLLSEAS